MPPTERDQNLQDWLRSETRFSRLQHVDCCESTQLLAQADGQDCCLFWADHQTDGRGRQGRSWSDNAAQDLALTYRVTGLVLQNPTRLASAIPIAILRALAPRLDDLRIKWPNDLLVAGRKLCGVLIDSIGGVNPVHCIGFGINVNRSHFPVELQDSATSMALQLGREFDRHRLVQDLSQEIERTLICLANNDLDSLVQTLHERMVAPGTQVRLATAHAELQGKLLHLDLDQLRIRDALGKSHEIPLAHLHRLA